MNIQVNANTVLKRAIGTKWGWDEDSSPGSNARKEWWYAKLAEVRRAKLLRCSEQQNHRCCYCGVRTWHPHYSETGSKRFKATLEHVVSRSNGGTDSMNNLAMACSRCNNGRGDHFEAIEFYEMVVGIRPMRRMTKSEENKELIAKREANKVVRTHRLVVETAYMLTRLDLWDWWQSWYETGLSVEE